MYKGREEGSSPSPTRYSPGRKKPILSRAGQRLMFWAFAGPVHAGDGILENGIRLRCMLGKAGKPGSEPTSIILNFRFKLD